MHEIEDKERIENWKTTKEVADALGVSPITLRVFRSQNKQQFKGLVMRSDTERTKKQGGDLLWSPEAIKILMLNISNPQVDQWKEDVIDEYTEKGIVVSKSMITDPENRLELIKLQSLQIQRQSQQIVMVIDEIQQVKEDIRDLQKKANEKYVIPRTRKLLRDEVHRIAIEYFNGDHYQVWVPLRNRHNISSYHELTEINAQKELDFLLKKYPPKKHLDYFK